MARSKNASLRTGVMRDLKAMGKRIEWLKGAWTARTELYDFDAPRDEHGNVVYRERREDEYPENDPAAWLALYNQADALAQQAANLRDAAAEQMAEARRRRYAGQVG